MPSQVRYIGRAMFFPLRDYNPTRRLSILTILLIAVNAGVFLYQNVQPELPPAYFIASYAMVPREISHLRSMPLQLPTRSGGVVEFPRSVYPLLTILFSLFIHGDLMHIIGNMLFLWIFGNNVEDYLGRLRFLLFYFLCGVGANLVHVLFHPSSAVPVVGASGAVSGIMGAYLILYPRARIRTLVFLVVLVTFVDLPAAVFLIVWFFFQFLYGAGSNGIAWLAHVGGFLLGILFLLLLKFPTRPPPAERLVPVETGEPQGSEEEDEGDNLH